MRFCFDREEKEGSEGLDYYRAKLNEGLALVFVEQYFFKSGKEYMLKAQAIHEKIASQSQLAKLKFKLKFVNFWKKAGFYEKAFEEINAIEGEAKTMGDKLFIYRLLRDKSRILAIKNMNDEAH